MSDLDPSTLIPGDVLLYEPSGIIGDIIAFNTHGLFSHAEVVCSPGKVVAARLKGCDIYPIDISKHMVCVRRHTGSTVPFESEAAMEAVSDDVGKPYYIGGLFSFFNPWRRSNHIHRICSVIVNHYLVGGGFHVFNPDADPNLLSPTDLWLTWGLETIWKQSVGTAQSMVGAEKSGPSA